MGNSNYVYIRGGLWWANLSGCLGSSVQAGNRPVVIVSSTIGCLTSNIVTVCPLTTKIKDLSVNVEVKSLVNGRPQQVLTNQIVTLPKSGLISHIGNLDKNDMLKVDRGILFSLGIPSHSVVKPTTPVSKDFGELEELLPKAREMVNRLSELIGKADKLTEAKPGRNYIKRSKEEISDFIKEWENLGNNRNEVASSFGFNSYGAAYNFYVNHKKRV